MTAGASGSGNGTVTFSAAANPAAQTRQGTISIGGQTFTVNQAAAPCTYSVSPLSSSVGASGGGGIGKRHRADRLRVDGGHQYAGVVERQRGCERQRQRHGDVRGRRQWRRPDAPGHADDRRTDLHGESGGARLLVLAHAGQRLGRGDGRDGIHSRGRAGRLRLDRRQQRRVVADDHGRRRRQRQRHDRYSAAANSQTQTRQGTLTIGGQTFTVNQAAAACSFTISPATLSVAANGASSSTSITTTSSCPWSSQSNAGWITITTATGGTGNGSVGFTVSGNTTSSQRTGTLTVAGRTFTVTQAANTSCTYALGAASQTVLPGGGQASVTLTTGTSCFWTATTTDGWMTLSQAGSGSRTITFTVTPNSSGSSRTGTLTIGGQTHTVTQGSATAPVSPRNLRVVIAINSGGS